MCTSSSCHARIGSKSDGIERSSCFCPLLQLFWWLSQVCKTICKFWHQFIVLILFYRVATLSKDCCWKFWDIDGKKHDDCYETTLHVQNYTTVWLEIFEGSNFCGIRGWLASHKNLNPQNKCPKRTFSILEGPSAKIKMRYHVTLIFCALFQSDTNSVKIPNCWNQQKYLS